MNSFQYQALFLGIILLIIIFFSLSNVEPVPYSNNSVFSKTYPYSEGIANLSPEQTTEKHNKTDTGERRSPEGANLFEKMMAKPESFLSKVEGFEGLQSSPYGSETPIDIFSQLKSGTNCESSPFSNSLGYLCLDQNAKQMLLTRGGNLTNNNVQVGNK